MFNQTVIIGRLGADADFRSVNADRDVVNMRVATTSFWNGAEHTEWFQVAVFAQKGKLKGLEDNGMLSKGQIVSVTGEVRLVRNTNGEGREFANLTINTNQPSLRIVGRNDMTDGQQAPDQQAPAQQAPVQQAPVQQAPVQQAPVQQAPVQQAPVQQAPVQQAPVQQAPVQQAPVQQGAYQEPPQFPTDGGDDIPF